MSTKNYQAFLKAARKRDGGLSLPAARKVYKKVAARLGRSPKGVDVKKHPRIFRESLPAAARRRISGLSKVRKSTKASSAANTGGKSRPGSVVGRIPAGKKSATRGGVVSRKAQQAGPSRLVVKPPAPVEYVSTPEYKKGGPKGGGLLQLQIHIIGPPGLRKSALDKVAERWLTDGSTPPGIEVKALGWNGKNPTQESRGMRVARSDFRHIPFTF